jgi:hypothetical protein
MAATAILSRYIGQMPHGYTVSIALRAMAISANTWIKVESEI